MWSVEYQINNRPRKRHGELTPVEVCFWAVGLQLILELRISSSPLLETLFYPETRRFYTKVNPHGQAEKAHKDPKELVAELKNQESQINNLIREIKESL